MYTPGPWTAHDDDGTGTLPCVLAKQVTTFGNFYVAQCNVYEDARLIASAPDLLEALRTLTEYCEHIPGFSDMPSGVGFRATWEAARAAIEKATK